jgi:thiol-disulfide isomerase/thioredoxin
MAHFFLLAMVVAMLASASAQGASYPLAVSGSDIVSATEIRREATLDKPLAVVFLSAVCPCSESHIAELINLAASYPNINFVGVHSNSDESPALSKTYFDRSKLPFPVIQDVEGRLANLYGAFKTPHVFVEDGNGKILYRGGISNSHDFKQADRKYLREALVDIADHHPARTPEGRTLGCIIAR